MRHRVLGHLVLLNDFAADLQQFSARRGQEDLLTDLLEQHISRMLFKLADLGRYGGLRQVELFRGARKTQQARHRFEHLQLA